MRLDFAGKHVLLFGASRGIGRAAAFGFAEGGALLTIAARRRDALEALVPELSKAGAASVEPLVVDLDVREASLTAVQALVARRPVHVLINNTGGPPGGPLMEAGEDVMQKAMGRLVFTPHAITKLVVPGMIAAGFGRIVNVVSTSVKEPIAGLGVSNMCRAAVAAWSKTLARELPPGITINNVLPGYTDTERMVELRETTGKRRGVAPDQVLSEWLSSVPEKRLGTPQEIAAAVVFLASPLASFIRGQSLAADGGRLQSI
jgi:3-oxoacyl-[acyl-carrier protein] reductase